MKSFSAILPFPPSVNHLFMNVPRGGRVKTAKYRAWEKQADAAMPSGIVKLQGEVIAVYTFGRPDRRRRDVANLEKAVSDTLVRWGVLEDDCQIEDNRQRWDKSGELKPGECRVELVEAA
ncbi:endodeoxyribonuclease RusA-like protein [Rhizobium phaseoli]|uniref:RusA family crossover junction endodeoxyribonuclease n=1 Tax=Rhizobium phaseoli TaxID=396 RepID=UPI0007F13967|nr:RusA family crossover junction endodeoxyribonuclease [Rhizobium phaseoli]ANL71908.1 endodeoxyribonuclease RusA-like protein [Rhizobium phaseoli]